MSVRIVGKKGEGWRVIIQGYGFHTGSDLLTKAQAVKLAATVLTQPGYRKAVRA